MWIRARFSSGRKSPGKIPMYLLTVRFRSPARQNRPALEDANRRVSNATACSARAARRSGSRHRSRVYPRSAFTAQVGYIRLGLARARTPWSRTVVMESRAPRAPGRAVLQALKSDMLQVYRDDPMKEQARRQPNSSGRPRTRLRRIARNNVYEASADGRQAAPIEAGRGKGRVAPNMTGNLRIILGIEIPSIDGLACSDMAECAGHGCEPVAAPLASSRKPGSFGATSVENCR